MRRPMHRPGTIDRLDAEVKRMISDLRIEKGWTIDEIREKLLELGAVVSRSALARHTRSLDEVADDLRRSREMAKALVAETEPGEDDQLARLNLELLQNAIFQLFTAVREGGPLPAGQLMSLSIAVEKAAAALAKLQQVKERAEKRAAEKVMAKVREVAGKPGSGLSKETVDQIYHAVLGVAA